MRASQKAQLSEIKQLISRQRADLLDISAEIWMDDEVEDKGKPARIEEAVVYLENAVAIIRAITVCDNPPQTGEKETK
jgi:hypothetical protein